ncbi:MAG: hypothetical protein ACLTXT_00365 [Ruminococcus callidus]
MQRKECVPDEKDATGYTSVLEIVMYTTGILVSAKTLVELAHSDECENNTEEA